MRRDVWIWIRHVAAHHRDLLDDLGDALDGEQREADEQHQLGRPQDETTGVRRHFARAEGEAHVGHEIVDHQQDERHQEEQMPEQVDPVLDAPRERPVDDVDADVLVLLERVGRGQQERGAEQIPLQFKPGVRRHVERLADDRVDRADENRRQDQPADPFAYEFVKRVYQARESQKPRHQIPPLSRHVAGSFLPIFGRAFRSLIAYGPQTRPD